MSGEKEWKWWYFVVASVLIMGFGAYQIYDLRIGKADGSFILGSLAMFIGFASRGGVDDEEARVNWMTL